MHPWHLPVLAFLKGCQALGGGPENDLGPLHREWLFILTPTRLGKAGYRSWSKNLDCSFAVSWERDLKLRSPGPNLTYKRHPPQTGRIHPVHAQIRVFWPRDLHHRVGFSRSPSRKDIDQAPGSEISSSHLCDMPGCWLAVSGRWSGRSFLTLRSTVGDFANKILAWRFDYRALLASSGGRSFPLAAVGACPAFRSLIPNPIANSAMPTALPLPLTRPGIGWGAMGKPRP